MKRPCRMCKREIVEMVVDALPLRLNPDPVPLEDAKILANYGIIFVAARKLLMGDRWEFRDWWPYKDTDELLYMQHACDRERGR